MFGARALAIQRQATISYATWNPSDKGGGVTLSNGNRSITLSTTPTDGGSVRSTIGKSSGKWYWEITVNGALPYSIPGVANASASVASNTFYGGTANGFGYYTANGLKYTNSPSGAGGVAYGSACAVGDVIGVALNMDAGTLTFYRNGVSQGVAFTGLSGTYYAADGNWTLNQALSTANFGASAFVHPVPSGFNQGLFNLSFGVLPGAVTLTTSGNWTVPDGVTSICVACVGAGGNGIVRTAFGGWWVGGSGGGLTYKNNIAVTPGQVISYTVATGAGSSTTFQTLSANSGNDGFEPGSSGQTNPGGISFGGDVNYIGAASNGASGGASNGGAAATIFGNGSSDNGAGTNFGNGTVPYGGGGISVHSPGTATNGQPGAIRIIWGTGKSFPSAVV